MNFLLIFGLLSYEASTGELNDEIETRVLGGSTTDISSIPFIVSILKGSKGYCGGSIVSNVHILTAAHCLLQQPSQVRIGSSFRNQGGVIYDIEKVIIHPNYHNNPMGTGNPANDVAVIKLKNKIKFGKMVQEVKLVGPNEQLPIRATVAGWGLDLTGGKRGNKLRMAEIPIMPAEECRNATVPADRHYISDQFLCGGSATNNACPGDSGGPVFRKDKIQIGLVSWSSRGGCRTNNPVFFISVGKFKHWIDSVIVSRIG